MKTRKTRKLKLNSKTKLQNNFNKTSFNKTVKTDDIYKKIKNKARCSPSSSLKSKNNYTCLDDTTLEKLKRLWNLRHPEDTIKTPDPKQIWDFLNNKMNTVCSKESCWLKQKFVNGKLNKELTESFTPEYPKEWNNNPNEWLSSVDINKVMKQYEDAYKCFDFIGPSPIDYDTRKIYGECVWSELCEFNLEEQIKNKKNKIGVIFNLDPHTKGGSHWVSLFINIKRKMIFFFDSAGEKIPDQIMKFVNTCISQGNSLKNPIYFKFDQNHPVEHQFGNTECGVYSLFFIVHMLTDKINSHYLKTHILKDKYIEKFRKIYFNTSV